MESGDYAFSSTFATVIPFLIILGSSIRYSAKRDGRGHPAAATSDPGAPCGAGHGGGAGPFVGASPFFFRLFDISGILLKCHLTIL